MHWLHFVRQIDKMARSLLHDLCFGLYILDLGGPHGYMLRQWLKVLSHQQNLMRRWQIILQCLTKLLQQILDVHWLVHVEGVSVNGVSTHLEAVEMKHVISHFPLHLNHHSPLETQTYSGAIQWSLQRDDGCPQCSRHEWIWNTDIHHPGPGRLAPVRCDEHQQVGPEAFQPVSLVTTSSLLQEYRLLILLLRSSSNTHGSHWRALWRSTIRGFRGSKAPFQDRNIRCITAKIKQFDDVEQSCGVNCSNQARTNHSLLVMWLRQTSLQSCMLRVWLHSAHVKMVTA